jgi:hypothetical protein
LIENKNDKPLGARKTQALPNEDQVKDFLNKSVVDETGGFQASKTISESDQVFSPSKTISDKVAVEFVGNKTVADFGNHDSSTSKEDITDQSQIKIIPCPSCGYPISGVARFCPNCSADLRTSSAKQTNTPKETKKSPKMKKERESQKTVNIFAAESSVIEEKVKLTEIKQSGENKLELLSEGKKIVLNNESLEQNETPANSSHVHAE